MKKLGWLLSAFVIVGFSTSSAYAECQVEPLPSEYSCSTQNVQVMLDNPNDMKYWQNPACLELIINGFGTYSDDQWKIITGSIRAAREQYGKELTKPTLKYHLWTDRKDWITYTYDPTVAANDSEDPITKNHIDSCTLFLLNNREIPLNSATEIILAYGCREDIMPQWCTGKYAQLTKNEVRYKRSTATYLATQTGCVTMLANWAKDFDNRPQEHIFVFMELLNAIDKIDITASRQQIYVDRCQNKDKGYSRCILDDQLNRLAALSIASPKEENGGTDNNKGSGGGPGGVPGGTGSGSGHVSRVSSFKVNF